MINKKQLQEIKKLIRESIEDEDKISAQGIMEEENFDDKISAQGIMEEETFEIEPQEDSVGEIAPIDNLPPPNNPNSHYGESEEQERINESLRLKKLSGII